MALAGFMARGLKHEAHGHGYPPRTRRAKIPSEDALSEAPTSTEKRGALRRLLPDLQALRETEATRLIAYGVLIGALAGVTAAAFDRGLVLLGQALLGSAEPAMSPPDPLRRVLAPLLAGLVAGAILQYGTRRGRALGLADVVASVQPEQRPISLRDGIASALGTLVAVASGQSGGRESPIVQLSGAVASRVGRTLRVRPNQFRLLVAAGSAGGIAASFNTPLGGAFFALEIILGSFAAESFAPVVAATVTATVVGQALLGDRIALQLPAFRLESGLELVPYAVLGLISALLAALFKRSVTLLSGQMDRLPLHHVLRTGLAGGLVGFIALGHSAVMGNGYRWIEALISGDVKRTVPALLWVLVLKFVATTVTQAGRSGAGLFAASLFIGAVTGTFVGKATQALFPELVGDPGAFGMVGMGAFAAAVLHAPVTLSLMLFEMTGNYEIVIPLLFANGIAALINMASRSESMLDIDLRRRGLQPRRARRQTVLDRIRVSDIARGTGYETARPGTPVSELAARFLARPIDAIYLVDEQGRYHGVVDLQDIKPHLNKTVIARTASEIASVEPPPIRDTSPVSRALSAFFRWEVEDLPVVDERGLFVGVVTERDVVAAWQSASIREGEMLAGFTSGPPTARQTDFVELPHGQALDLVEAGSERVGQTLRDLQLPQRFGCTVVAVNVYDPARGRWSRVAPDVNRPLEREDQLIVVGPRLQLRRLKGESDPTESLLPEDEPSTT